jgi:hypothetical protein
LTSAIASSILSAAPLLSRITTSFSCREATASFRERHSRSYLLRFFASLYGFLRQSNFFEAVLFDKRLGRVNAAGWWCGNRACNFDIAARDHSLFTILEPADLPPLFTLGIIENKYIVANRNSDLVVALSHKVIENLTFLEAAAAAAP